MGTDLLISRKQCPFELHWPTFFMAMEQHKSCRYLQ